LNAEWQLIVKGSHEILGDEGLPIDCCDYSTHFFFENLKSATNFINIHQKFALEYHEYELKIV
jgi:hypothetical protein